MAKDDDKKPTAAEKGKGKAVNGNAEKEVKKDKDGKPIQDDKKGVMPPGMFSVRSRRHTYLYRNHTDAEMQRSSARKINISRASWKCLLSGYWYAGLLNT